MPKDIRNISLFLFVCIPLIITGCGATGDAIRKHGVSTQADVYRDVQENGGFRTTTPIFASISP